jgi:hypothetical protein
MDLSEPRSKSVGPNARVRIPESMPTIPPLVQLAGLSRVAPSSPRRRGSSLGGPPSLPALVRVSTLPSRGQRKETMGDRRSRLDRTVPVSPYRFGSRCR